MAKKLDKVVQEFLNKEIEEEVPWEILGVKVAESEEETFWEDLFEDLKRRGLRGVELVVSDGHSGIVSAVKRSFLGASWQMCHTHFIRNVLRKVPKKRYKQVVQRLKEWFLSRRYLSIGYQAV